MNFLFLMDPLENVKPEKDTTFVLMIAARSAGHRVFFLPDGGMTLIDGRIHFDVLEVVPRKGSQAPFESVQKTRLSDQEADIVFIRSDPPFSDMYLMHTWLLDRLPKRVAVINAPAGIRTANEKIWASQFTDLVPPTLIGRNREQLHNFLNKHQEIICKPTNGFGGQSIFRLHKRSDNINVVFETLTRNFQQDIVLQKYLPAADVGDKRILLLNGDPLGAVLRIHSGSDHRNNFFSGGRAEKTSLTARDHQVITSLKPHLQALGLYFVGIDIIGNYLIEVNVTSPTCVQEIDRLNGQCLEKDIISFAVDLAHKKGHHNA